MKILHLNCVYKYGSTGKIVDCIALDLRSNGHYSIVCYGNGNEYYDDYSKKICTNVEHLLNAFRHRIDGLPLGGYYFSNKRVERVITEFSPDVVHVHCINGSILNVYSLLKYLAYNNLKTVVTLHAEFMFTGGCAHAFDCEKWKTHCRDCSRYKREVSTLFFDRSYYAWQKMYDAFRLFKSENIIITAVSPWLADRAKMSPMFADFKVESVLNGLNEKIFYRRLSEAIIDREHYDKVALFVTPSFDLDANNIKGGYFLSCIADRLTNTKFIVVCSGVIPDNLSLPSNIQIWGKARSQDELAQLYSEADYTLLLSRKETFSMVTAESLCCGTPVVGFKAGGPESIALPHYSTFVEYANVDALLSAVDIMLNNSYNRDRISKEAIAHYSSNVMTTAYCSIYSNFLNGKS